MREHYIGLDKRGRLRYGAKSYFKGKRLGTVDFDTGNDAD